MNFWNNPFINWNNLWPYTFDVTMRYFFFLLILVFGNMETYIPRICFVVNEYFDKKF